MSHVLSTGELEARLREQCGFLRSSVEGFDNGDLSEALRLAVVVRVLLHDTSASTSLLEHLGVKDKIEYLDTSAPLPPDEDVPPRDGQPGRQSRAIGAGLATMMSTGGAWSFQPFFGDRPSRVVSFDEWWTTNVSRGPSGRSLARKDVVLALANKEGGAHVDDVLDENWAKITRSGSFKTVASGVATVLNPAPAMMRQIAYEVDKTLSSHLPPWSLA